MNLLVKFGTNISESSKKKKDSREVGYSKKCESINNNSIVVYINSTIEKSCRKSK